MQSLKTALLSCLYSASICYAQNDPQCDETDVSCVAGWMHTIGHGGKQFCGSWMHTSLQPTGTNYPAPFSVCGNNIPNHAAKLTTACSCAIPSLPYHHLSIRDRECWLKSTLGVNRHINRRKIISGSLNLAPEFVVAWSGGLPGIGGWMQVCADYSPHFELHVLQDDGAQIWCLAFHYTDPSEFTATQNVHQYMVTNAWSALRTAPPKAPAEIDMGNQDTEIGETKLEMAGMGM